MRMTTAGTEPVQADVTGFVIELNLLLGDDRNLLSGFIFTEPVQADVTGFVMGEKIPTPHGVGIGVTSVCRRGCSWFGLFFG